MPRILSIGDKHPLKEHNFAEGIRSANAEAYSQALGSKPAQAVVAREYSNNSTLSLAEQAHPRGARDSCREHTNDGGQRSARTAIR